MENLGRNSKAVHRAYAKRALMKLPALEEYEQKAAVLADGHCLLAAAFAAKRREI